MKDSSHRLGWLPAAALLVLAIAALTAGSRSPAVAALDASANQALQPLSAAAERGPRLETGEWTARDRGDRVWLELTSGGRGQFGTTFEPGELEGFDDLDDGRFMLVRDAGVFTFEVDRRVDSTSRWGEAEHHGTFTFAVDPGYVEEMATLGFDEVEVRRESGSLALLDVSRSFVGDMRDLVYDVPLEELIELRIHGVSREYVDEMAALGYGGLSASRLVEMRIHGVTAGFVEEIRELGYRDVPVSKLLEMRIHGVTPGQIRAHWQEGDERPDLDRMVAFRIHGVDEAMVDELAALGYQGLGDDELLAFSIHGVDAGFIEELAALGYERLPPDELVGFSIHGVSPSFIREMAALGYGRLHPDRLIAFRIHGVSPELVEELAEVGYRDLDAEELVAFRIHGVGPELIERLAARGITGLTADELVELRIHGLDRGLTRD